MNNDQVWLCQKMANAFTLCTQMSLLVHTWDLPQQLSNFVTFILWLLMMQYIGLAFKPNGEGKGLGVLNSGTWLH